MNNMLSRNVGGDQAEMSDLVRDIRFLEVSGTRDNSWAQPGGYCLASGPVENYVVSSVSQSTSSLNCNSQSRPALPRPEG